MLGKNFKFKIEIENGDVLNKERLQKLLIQDCQQF